MRRIVFLMAIATMFSGCGGQQQPAAPDPLIVSQAVQTAVASIPTSQPVEVTRVVEVTREVPVDAIAVVGV